jgi:hypothetical protein
MRIASLRRTSLREIGSLARPSQRITVDGVHDDQPLDAMRAEAAASFFTDPLTRFSVIAGAYQLDTDRRGTRDGQSVLVENETRFPPFLTGGSLGIFTFPDGEHRPIGSVRVAYRQLELRVDHREEIASATSLSRRQHGFESRWGRHFLATDAHRHMLAPRASISRSSTRANFTLFPADREDRHGTRDRLRLETLRAFGARTRPQSSRAPTSPSAHFLRCLREPHIGRTRRLGALRVTRTRREGEVHDGGCDVADGRMGGGREMRPCITPSGWRATMRTLHRLVVVALFATPLPLFAQEVRGLLAGEALELTAREPNRIAGSFTHSGVTFSFEATRQEGTVRAALLDRSGRELLSATGDPAKFALRFGGGRLNVRGVHDASPQERSTVPRDFDGELQAAVEFTGTAEYRALPFLSRALGANGITGKTHPASLYLHGLALSSAKRHGTRVPPLDDVAPSANCQDRTGDPCGDRCLGMCGPECTCWSWVCGDCCGHIGCLVHDLTCRLCDDSPWQHISECILCYSALSFLGPEPCRAFEVCMRPGPG